MLGCCSILFLPESFNLASNVEHVEIMVYSVIGDVASGIDDDSFFFLFHRAGGLSLGSPANVRMFAFSHATPFAVAIKRSCGKNVANPRHGGGSLARPLEAFFYPMPGVLWQRVQIHAGVRPLWFSAPV